MALAMRQWAAILNKTHLARLWARMKEAGLEAPLRTSIARKVIASLHGGLKHLADVVPVHQMVKERFEVVGTAIAIINVIRMFPHVAAEDRLGAVYERILAVRRFHDRQFTVLHREPAPARTELRDARLDQVFLDFGQRADIRGELFLELARQFVTAAALLHPFPKVNVIEVLGRVIEQARIFTERTLDDFFDRFVFPFGAFGKIVAGVHIGLMMFIVMEFERLA